VKQNNLDSIQPQIEDSINLTPRAIKEIRRLIKEQDNADDPFLRVGVEGGGCSGLSYTMSFDTAVNNNDKVYNFDGLRIVSSDTALKYLAGTTIDFNSGLLAGGFKFSNPRAVRGCGCGSSFSI
jgi:iron-sulfur cluster assembly protein